MTNKGKTPMTEVDAWPFNGALSSDFYSINRALRGEQRFGRGCGPFLDWHGWTSEEKFAEALQRSFYDLHTAGWLGNRQGSTAYREIWFRKSRIAQFLREKFIWDEGYTFATPSALEAKEHLENHRMEEKGIYLRRDETDPFARVMLRIRIGRTAAYLPGSDDDDPLQLRAAGYFTNKLVDGQYILERHSMLKITDVSYRAPTPQMPLVLIKCDHVF